MARRTIHIADELVARVVERAEAEDRSVSWCIARAVEAWLGDPQPLKRADRASVAADAERRAAHSSAAAPRASAPIFNRATQLGGAPAPVDRRTR